jgi:hypothetical protein
MFEEVHGVRKGGQEGVISVQEEKRQPGEGHLIG